MALLSIEKPSLLHFWSEAVIWIDVFVSQRVQLFVAGTVIKAEILQKGFGLSVV